MRTSVVAGAAALAMAGCLSYSPQQYSAMTAYDLCELEHYQRINLSAAAKAALADELKRRNESCRGVLPQIAQDHADDDYDRMYNRQSP